MYNNNNVLLLISITSCLSEWCPSWIGSNYNQRNEIWKNGQQHPWGVFRHSGIYSIRGLEERTSLLWVNQLKPLNRKYEPLWAPNQSLTRIMLRIFLFINSIVILYLWITMGSGVVHCCLFCRLTICRMWLISSQWKNHHHHHYYYSLLKHFPFTCL